MYSSQQQSWCLQLFSESPAAQIIPLPWTLAMYTQSPPCHNVIDISMAVKLNEFLPQFGFHCCDKHGNSYTFGRKSGFTWLTLPRHSPSRKESVQELKQKPGVRKCSNTIKGCCSSFASSGWFNYFSSTTQAQHPRNGTTNSGPGYPISISN